MPFRFVNQRKSHCGTEFGDFREVEFGVKSRIRRRFGRQTEWVALHRAKVRLYTRDSSGRRFSIDDEDSQSSTKYYDRIKGNCIEVLQNDLPRECRNLGLPVASAMFKRADNGSLELLFTTVWDFVQLAGGIAAFYDALHLVDSLAENLLERAAVSGDRRDMMAEVSCESVFPSRHLLRELYIDVPIGYGKRNRVLLDGCSENMSAMRTTVVCLSVTVVVLAITLVWFGWKITSL